MLCYKPFRKDGDEFGCGQCLPCLANRRRLWTLRLMLEAQLHERSCFVTLTYDDDHLPSGGNLVPQHTQEFLKRLRYYCDPVRIRYYLCGEYGDKFGRPHYHAAIFGINDSILIEKAWEDGFVRVGDLSIASASYIVSYITKGMRNAKSPELKGRHPEFSRMSLRPGIGASAVAGITSALGNFEVASLPKAVRIEGKMWPLGRYLTGLLRESRSGSRKESDGERDARRRDFRMQFPDFSSRQVRHQKRLNQYEQLLYRLQVSKSKKEF